ncbi:MAG: DUF5701 family protein [bacterium]
MSQLVTKKRKDKEELEMLFYNQWLMLKKRGCPKQILEFFNNQKNEVVSVASRISFTKGNLPILLVLPRTSLTIHTQMTMVRNGKIKGYTMIDPVGVFEMIKTPSRPYYLFDVENGRETLGQSPEKAEKIIKKQRRLCSTEVEIINLALQTNVLKRHYLDATGCRYIDESKVPYLGMIKDKPILHWYRLKNGHPFWGSPSCGKRLAL